MMWKLLPKAFIYQSSCILLTNHICRLSVSGPLQYVPWFAVLHVSSPIVFSSMFAAEKQINYISTIPYINNPFSPKPPVNRTFLGPEWVKLRWVSL